MYLFCSRYVKADSKETEKTVEQATTQPLPTKAEQEKSEPVADKIKTQEPESETVESAPEEVKESKRGKKGTPPEFILKPRNRKTLEGNTVRLTCSVNGDPEPTIEWYFDGEVFTPDSRRQIKKKFGLSTITIDSVGAEDIGEYTSVVKNDFGEIRHTATVEIEGLEKASSKKPSKVKGEAKPVDVKEKEKEKPKQKGVAQRREPEEPKKKVEDDLLEEFKPLKRYV